MCLTMVVCSERFGCFSTELTLIKNNAVLSTAKLM